MESNHLSTKELAEQMAKSMRLWGQEGGMSTEADIGVDEVTPEVQLDPVPTPKASPTQPGQ